MLFILIYTFIAVLKRHCRKVKVEIGRHLRGSSNNLNGKVEERVGYLRDFRLDGGTGYIKLGANGLQIAPKPWDWMSLPHEWVLMRKR